MMYLLRCKALREVSFCMEVFVARYGSCYIARFPFYGSFYHVTQCYNGRPKKVSLVLYVVQDMVVVTSEGPERCISY